MLNVKWHAKLLIFKKKTKTKLIKEDIVYYMEWIAEFGKGSLLNNKKCI